MRLAGFLATMVAAATIVLPVHAATVARDEIYMSASRCQPALPAFDGAIRKRPLAMQNEGTATAFVTCGFDGLSEAMRSKKFIRVGLINNGAQSVTVNCTLVDGQSGFSSPAFFTKSATLVAGSTAEIIYSTSDNGGNKFIYPATSCGLPPGVAIQYVGASFDEEIGA